MKDADDSDDTHTARADAEAIEWILLLREAEPADAGLLRRFEAWLTRSPGNARAWADAAYAYDLAGDARPTFASPVRRAETRPVLPVPPRRRSAPMARRRMPRRRTLVATAAVACIALAIAPSLWLRVQADHVSGTAELRTVTLADGSVARLAPDSAIAVTYAANRRQVRLLKGEAWFDVRHDTQRPFYVDTGGITTTVLGTAFDVRRHTGGATTQVERGRVRVDFAGAAPPVSEQLRPGDGVRIGFDGRVDRLTLPADQVAAWRQRRVIVRNRPISDVIDALRPWHGGVIVVRGRFASKRVTGVYDAANPAAAMRTLAQTHGGSIATLTPWLIVLGDR